MTNPIEVAPKDDPWSDWQKDMIQYNTDKTQWSQDQQDLATACAALKNIKDAAARLMYVVYMVFPALMKSKESNIKMLSDTMNIGTDLRNQAAVAQDALNKIKTDTNDADRQKDAKTFADAIGNLYTETKLSQASGVLDDQSAGLILDAIKGIVKPFGDDWQDPVKMAYDIQNWWINSSKGDSNIKNLLNGLQTINQTTSTFGTSTGTEFSFCTNQYNQITNLYNNGFMKPINQQESVFIQNMGKNS